MNHRRRLQLVPLALLALVAPVAVGGGPALATQAARSSPGPNPYLALLPGDATAGTKAWRERLDRLGAARESARRAAQGAAARPVPVAEAEPSDLMGANDTPQTAQQVARFGTRGGAAPAVRVSGSLAQAVTRDVAPSAEDDGAIQLARRLVLPDQVRVRTTGTVGDGPHGSAGGATGDFDFLRFSGRQGQRLIVDIDTPNSDLDSMLTLWSAEGEVLASNDDQDGVDSLLSVDLPTTGTFLVSVAGFPFAAPTDPRDPASGSGVGSEGAYTVSVGLNSGDLDHYAFSLRRGDVLGVSADGSVARASVLDPSGREVVGSMMDVSAIYPLASRLPGGGNAVLAHVADEAGRYVVALSGAGSGSYAMTVEGYRPGLEPTASRVQTVFLDFNGARVNTGIWGGWGVRDLSPMSAFLSRWGLRASDQRSLIDQVVAGTAENLRRDLRAVSPGARVRILDSLHHRDPGSRPDVSRVVIGGTIEESGVPTIGIAQSIDVGNFETDEIALVLLDILSAERDSEFGDASLNSYIRPGSNRVRFVGQALANIVAHEAGHYLGSFHVDQYDATANLMDAGGNFPVLFGVGPDGIGGTADDVDVDYGEDTYNPAEGFSGTEDTAVMTAFGLTWGGALP